MNDTNRMTGTETDTQVSPAESDEAIEPIEVSEINDGRFLFYLAGEVPVALQELAENTSQSSAALRDYFYTEFQNMVDIDPTGFVRLADGARKPVIRASKPYIRSGEDLVDAGQESVKKEFYGDAADRFNKAIKIFEQIQSRFENVNYWSQKLEQRIETVRDSEEMAQEAVGDSATQVESLFDDDQSEANPTESTETTISDSGTDDSADLVAIIQNVHDQLGYVPSPTEVAEECEYSENDFYAAFGNWEEALNAAEIDKKQALLDDVERVAEKLGRVPKSTDMDKHGTYSGSNCISCFGSWSTVLEQSAIDVEKNREEKLLETIRSLCNRLDRLPKTTDLHDVSGVSQHDYIKKFGSWDEALDAAGINKKQHLIDDLKAVADEVDSRPKTTDVNQIGAYSASMHQKYFGSWDAALDAAGLSATDTTTAEKSTRKISSNNIEQITPSTPTAELSSHIDGIGPQSVSRLKSSGYTILSDLCNVEPKGVAKRTGIQRTKAIEAVRFATENISESGDNATEQSKEHDTKSPSHSNATIESSNHLSVNSDTPIDKIEQHVDGVGRRSIQAVKKSGCTTLEELCNIQPRELTKYKGIGRMKALKLIRFARENVSQNQNTSTQTSNGQTDTTQSSSSIQGSDPGQIQSNATNSSWETIPANERIDGQFLLKVIDIDRQAGSRKDVRLDVQDQNHRAFAMNIWSKHNISQDWTKGEWYALEQVRGKVWESSDGTTRKQLSSTKDLEITELGPDFDPDAGSTVDMSQSESETQQSATTGGEDASAGESNPLPSDQSDTGVSGEKESNDTTNRTNENKGVLDDIMSDFDEI